MRPIRVSCSLTRRATARTGMDLASITTNASNSKVKLLSALAQGTATRWMPQREHSTREVRAWRKAWCWKKFRRAPGRESVLLEKVQVPPGQIVRVVGFAGTPANRAREDAAPRKIQMDIQASGRLLKGAATDQPRRQQPQGCLKEFVLVHRGAPPWRPAHDNAGTSDFGPHPIAIRSPIRQA